MDYLDPQKKRLKKNYLMLMYGLLGVAIAIATIILIYLVNGYSIDRKTGEVIQNGLIYIDTKPESAEIYLNGEKQRGRTDARLVVPEGSYSIELRREGYRTWQRSLILEGGSLRRLTYARLVPETLDSEPAFNLPFTPTLATQSVDKRWLILAEGKNPLSMRIIDLTRAELRADVLQLPLNILDAAAGGRWEAIDWADDNRTLLASYTLKNSTEYVLIDRQTPENSKKLKTVFSSLPFTEVSLRNRKRDQVFLFNKKNQTVYRGNVTNGDTAPVLEKVIDFVAFGDDNFLYMTDNGSEKDSVRAVLKHGDQSYQLRNLKKDESYLLALSKLGSSLVLGVGSPVENRVIVYNDPIKALKENDFSDLPVPTTVLNVVNPSELIISSDSSVILTRGGQKFASHEFEEDRSYSFKVDAKLDKSQKIHWYDGRHASISVLGKQLLFDYDGSNQYELVESIPGLGSVMDRDMNLLYSFQPSERNSPTRLIRTFMRSSGDR